MISMMIWVLALAGSIVAVCFAVAFDAQSAHLSATAFVSFGMVAAAIHEHRTAELAGATPYRLAATASRYMGVLWCWNALSAFAVYSFLLDWPYWLPIVVAMFLACGVCLFVAIVLDREDSSVSPDRWAPVLVTAMAKSQFTVSAVLLGMMFAARQSSDVGFGGAHRWVALNLILCTAAALLTLTGYLIMNRSSQPASNTVLPTATAA